MRSDFRQRILELESEMADVKDWIAHDRINGNDIEADKGENQLEELNEKYAELMENDLAFFA